MAKLWPVLLLAVLSGPAQAQGTPEPSQDTAAPPRCSGIENCVGELIAQAERGRQPGDLVEAQLVAEGAAAVDRLVPLLSHPGQQVRDSVGLVLTGFRRIDPKHLPALVHAWRHGDTPVRQGRGNGWMPRPIAATGTDEALRLLWENFQRDPQHGSNAQVFFALADMGPERIRPLVQQRFAECRTSVTAEECEGLLTLLHEFKPAMPDWALAEIVELAGTALSDTARAAAETELVRLQHPAGVAAYQRRLALLKPAPADDDQRWAAGQLIGGLARYGSAAQAAGPLILPFLQPQIDSDLRAEAALALGRIGYAQTAPALIAMAPELDEDWVLAYNVAESLGRLRTEEARPLLERLARTHWHRGVRNNATRALNMLAGGPFALADVPGDPQPIIERNDDGEELVYMGNLRSANDRASRACDLPDEDNPLRIATDPVGTVRWSTRELRQIRFGEVKPATAAEVRRHVPVKQVQGRVVGVMPLRSGELVAFNGGEFGGGLFHLPEDGEARALFRDPVKFAWRMNGKLFVAAGLAHLVSDTGSLYVVDPGSLRVERTIRLPASPGSLSTGPGYVVIGTGAGDVGVRADGSLADAATLGGCAED